VADIRDDVRPFRAFHVADLGELLQVSNLVWIEWRGDGDPPHERGVVTHRTSVCTWVYLPDGRVVVAAENTRTKLLRRTIVEPSGDRRERVSLRRWRLRSAWVGAGRERTTGVSGTCRQDMRRAGSRPGRPIR
jgi:hypothetical protein